MPWAAWARATTGATIWRSSGSRTPLPPGFRMAVPQYRAKCVSVVQRGAYQAWSFSLPAIASASLRMSSSMAISRSHLQGSGL